MEIFFDHTQIIEPCKTTFLQPCHARMVLSGIHKALILQELGSTWSLTLNIEYERIKAV